MDRFSKWVKLKGVINTETAQVLTFIKQIITDNGHPETIKTDNTSCFNSKSYIQFLESEGINYDYVTPYVHKGNETVERTIRTIDAYLKIFFDEKFSLRDRLLKLLQY